MPDLWDTNPDNVFRPSGKQPNPAPAATMTTANTPRRCCSRTTAATSGHPRTS
jgi:hypothetical protein